MGAAAKGYTLHCVGHAHIDMNWMWSWPETVAVTNDSFLTVLRLMEEYPEFRFSQSQASVYAILERHNPSLLKRIAQRVREGRWEVTASHWVEGDKNIAGGESLTRHLLYTRRYMERLFGLKPEDVSIDWSPDTFGHAITMPTYLVRGGVKYLYLHRPGVHTPSKPDAFWWQAPGGSRILVRNDMKYGYNQAIVPGLADNLMGFAKEFGAKDFISVYGVGDHGGGPTRRDIVRGLDMATWPIFPTVLFSTARAFYEKLAQMGDKLPTVTTELNTEFTGCYTTQSLVKKVCRFGETRLLDAESASALAWASSGFAYPTDAFVEGWRDILFSHFHDILPGSGVHDTRTYTHGLYQKTVASTSQIEAQALRLLASRVDTSFAGYPEDAEVPPSSVGSSLGAGAGFLTVDGGLCQGDQSTGDGPRPYLFYNPTARERREVLELTLWQGFTPGRPLHERAYVAKFADGTTQPAQVTGSGDFWGHSFVKLAVPATVPALGYTVGVVDEVEQAPETEGGARQIGLTHHCSYAPIERGMEGLENEFLRLEVDPNTGGIRSLVHKATGKVLVSDAPLLEYAVERPHGMTAWAIDHTGPTEYPSVTRLGRKGDGPHTAALEVGASIHESDFTVTYELRAGDPRLHVHIAGTWFQRGTPQTGVPVLTYALPTCLEDAQARYEVPFGAIDRDLNQGEELPALTWAQVSGKLDGQPAGCLLLNDTKHGYSLKGSTLRLTLIRSGYDPDNLPEIGNHEIHLALLPFAGELPVAQAARAGLDLNHAIRVVSTDVHSGALPSKLSGFTLSPDNVVLTTLKKAEEGDALTLRVYETAGKDTEATLTLNPALLGAVTAAEEVDLMERPLPTSTAPADGNTVTVKVPAYGIASVKVGVSR
jgi:alpha-mannosidase